MLTFNKDYFALAVLFFFIEILSAFFIHDTFIRPYFGDILVVILMYSFLKSFFKFPVLNVALFVLIISFTVEFLQFLNIVEKLSLEKSQILKTVLGTSFSWIDLLTYIAGITIIIVIEKYYLKKELTFTSKP